MTPLLIAALVLPSQADALTRLRAINVAFRQYGAEAKPIIDAFAEDAAYALNSCQPKAGGKLLAAYNAGELDSIRPFLPQLLRLIADHRDVGRTQQSNPCFPDRIVLFLITHVEEFKNPIYLAAFVADPQTYILGLKPQKPDPIVKTRINSPPPPQNAEKVEKPVEKVVPARMIQLGGYTFPVPDIRILIGGCAVFIAVVMAYLRSRSSDGQSSP